MSAIDERPAAAAPRKSTLDSQLSAGEATWALTLPHLPYGDAIHAALTTAGLVPAVLDAGLRIGKRGAGELFLRLVWLPGSRRLGEAARADGLTVAWSHVTGWSAHDRQGGRVLLDVDTLADPALITDATQHFARHGLAHGWVSPFSARWSEAVYLDIALCRFDEREAIR
ncbi:hypothetical protein ABZ890_12130 [Streptomyces sp. NPDC046984]|uniref:hypothetical protein n=1 Tax=Streptomyces sp. NPDC046984 TaxID=3155138 RepID=UPI0033F38B63